MNKTIDKREDILTHLNKIIETQSRLVNANFDVKGFTELVVNQMQTLTPATGVVVELVDGDDMVYQAATGTVKAHIGLRLPRLNSISGLCVQQKMILRSDDTTKDSRVNPEACRLVGAKSMVVAPLFHEGNAVGVIKILSSEPHEFSEDDVNTLELMAGLIGSALAHQLHHDSTQQLLIENSKTLEELRRSEEILKYKANYDFLTDLPNRSYFLDILQSATLRAKRGNKLISVLFLDVDHFKNINDTYGHDIGDELLKAFAARIKKSIRETDTAARLGGDEFIILLDDIAHENNAIYIAEKIIENMQSPFKFKDIIINISTSIGIAVHHNKTYLQKH